MNKRVALVCGGSKGIGWACAKALAQEGARIILLARSEGLLKHRIEELSESGSTAAFPTGDLSLIPSLPGLVDQASSIFGPIEILINNTGGPPSGSPLSFTADDWEKAFRGTFLSTEVTTRLLRCCVDLRNQLAFPSEEPSVPQLGDQEYGNRHAAGYPEHDGNLVLDRR